jgi:periplasmic protein TonB
MRSRTAKCVLAAFTGFAALHLMNLPLPGADNGAITPPEVVQRKRPDYPYELKRKGIEGSAIIQFSLDEQGRPFDVRVAAATHPAFGESAARAVEKTKFNPARRNGHPIVFHGLRLSFGFRLTDPNSPPRAPAEPANPAP